MIISEEERNRIKKLHRNQFVLTEGISISPEGDWVDDGEQSQPLNAEESQECYVAAEDDEKVWMKELSTNTNSRCKGMKGRRKKQCKINEILRDYEQKLQKRNMPSCRKGTWISTRVRKKREWLEFRMGLNKK